MEDNGSKALQSAPKLKDSCDMCSASKVRCNKEKPACGRCIKLGYPCSYSPARRVGRPYPQRTPSQNMLDTATTESSGQHHRLSRLNGDSRDLRSEPFSSHERRIPPREEASGDVGLHHHHARRSTISLPRPVEPPNPDYDNEPSHSLGQMTPNSRSDQSNPSHAISKTSEPVSGISSIRGNSTAESKPLDCASTAMESLQQLDMTSRHLQLETTRGGGQMDAESLEAALTTVTTAFKRLSTILICPCSERLETSLLVASVCISMLDVHNIIISNSKSSKDQAPPSSSEGTAQWDRMDVCTKCTPDHPEYTISTLKVLRELPKVAKSVLQFTNRYSDPDGEEDSADFLPALAVFLRGKLQVITDNVTEQLG